MPDLPNPNDNISKAIVRELGAYLKDNVEGIMAVYDDFPAPNQKLVMPCASISMGDPTVTLLSPYVIKRTEVPNDPPIPGENDPYEVVRVYGMIDWSLQVDLWCPNKFDRTVMLERLMVALNPKSDVSGLNIKLTDYYGLFAHYNMRKMLFLGGEEASQRGEWRVKVDLDANSRIAKPATEHLIETIENTIETPISIDPSEEDSEEPII